VSDSLPALGAGSRRFKSYRPDQSSFEAQHKTKVPKHKLRKK